MGPKSLFSRLPYRAKLLQNSIARAVLLQNEVFRATKFLTKNVGKFIETLGPLFAKLRPGTGALAIWGPNCPRGVHESVPENGGVRGSVQQDVQKVPKVSPEC